MYVPDFTTAVHVNVERKMAQQATGDPFPLCFPRSRSWRSYVPKCGTRICLPQHAMANSIQPLYVLYGICDVSLRWSWCSYCLDLTSKRTRVREWSDGVTAFPRAACVREEVLHGWIDW